jgi:signal transduction histidine kinase/ActR/RegA family two-component response regulator
MLYRDKKDFEKALEYTDKFYTTKISNLEIGYSDENNILQAKMGLEEARREKRFAEEAMQMKSMFIASISHEIRTPMNIIIGSTALMMNDHPKPEHVKYLQVLKRSGENLLGIINDILDISKIEAGKFDIDMEPVQIEDVLEDVHASFRQTAAEKGIRVDYEVDPKLNFAFYSDPLRLTQILTNLIGNSIKFTTEGGVHTSVVLKPRNFLEITVRDTGIGIPKDKLPQVFEHYEQVKNQTQRKYKGTGLGLSISKKLVELMDGSITVKSRIHEGTSFLIRLPVKRAEKTQKTNGSLSDLQADFLKGRSILVVDDTEENRFITIETLKYFNPQVRHAEALNGKQALDILQKEPYDLVLMDLDMPVMNGFEALAAIRNKKKTRDQKVIATTASLLANGEEEFLELGFDGFLPKPFEPEKFLEMLRRQLA